MGWTKALTVLGAAAAALQPVAVSAQQACVTEEEAGAIAIYSVPSLVQAVRLRCDGQLSPNGFLARSGNDLINRYGPVQSQAWPKAKSGLIKVLTSKAGAAQRPGNLEMIRSLPDDAVRPLIDALIVQETSAKIPTGHCGQVERVIQYVAPIDPQTGSGLLGAIAGLVNHREFPVCRPRSS